MRDIKKKLMVIGAFVVIACFFVHAFSFDHDHPEVIFGSGEQAVLHSSDKKKVVDIAAIFVVIAVLAHLSFNARSIVRLVFFSFIERLLLRFRPPLQLILSRGTLQPKLCE